MRSTRFATLVMRPGFVCLLDQHRNQRRNRPDSSHRFILTVNQRNFWNQFSSAVPDNSNIEQFSISPVITNHQPQSSNDFPPDFVQQFNFNFIVYPLHSSENNRNYRSPCNSSEQTAQHPANLYHYWPNKSSPIAKQYKQTQIENVENRTHSIMKTHQPCKYKIISN